MSKSEVRRLAEDGQHGGTLSVIFLKNNLRGSSLVFNLNPLTTRVSFTRPAILSLSGISLYKAFLSH